MGVSTDGILCFGVDMGAEEDREGTDAAMPWEAGDDFEAWVCEQAGLVWRADFTDAEKDAYFAQCRAVVDAYPIQVVNHCSDSYCMTILAVRGSVTSAFRGYPVTPTMTVDPERVASFVAECASLGIALSAQPVWLLCSMWG